MSKPITYQGNDLEALAEMPNYYDWIVHCFAPYLNGRCAEVGAGTGTIARRTLPHLDTLDLIEPSANLVERLNTRFKDDAKVTVFPETLEAHLARDGEELYDCVVMVNVLEHIEHDSDAILGLKKLLKPGGYLLLFVPALPFLFSKIDELVGHYRRYTRPILDGRLQDAGMNVVQSRYMDLLGIAPWWLVNTVGGKTSFDPGAVKLYDSVGIPVTRIFETLITPPVGKNILCVARKSE